MAVAPEVRELLEAQTTELTELINGLKRAVTASNERSEQLVKDNIILKQQLNEARAEIDILRVAMAVNKTEAADDLAQHKTESSAAIKAAVVASNAKINGLRIELDDLEQYGRRKSIRLQNVPVVPNEDKDHSQDLLLTSVNETLAPSGIALRKKDIIRFHRSSAAKENKDVLGGKVSQCIIKLKNWHLRQQFQGLNTRMRVKEIAKTGGGCRVYHDLTKRRLALLNEARDQMQDGWFVYADINSNLKMRKGDKFLKFNTRDELYDHLDSLFERIPDEEPAA
jgi:hypothetical protein